MKYIASFIRREFFTDYCLPELKAVCDLLKLSLKFKFSYDIKKEPLIEIDIPDIETHANKIIARTVLTKNIIKVNQIKYRFIPKVKHMMIL
jgi:hypothetical protein